MKKIYIFAGIVFVCVLLIITSVFIFDLYDFSKNLGNNAEDIGTVEETKFIGTWETVYFEDDDNFVGYNGIYKFSADGSGTVGGLTCMWLVMDTKLIIDLTEENIGLIYDYSFSDSFNTMTLNNSKITMEFTKILD